MIVSDQCLQALTVNLFRCASGHIIFSLIHNNEFNSSCRSRTIQGISVQVASIRRIALIPLQPSIILSHQRNSSFGSRNESYRNLIRFHQFIADCGNHRASVRAVTGNRSISFIVWVFQMCPCFVHKVGYQIIRFHIRLLKTDSHHIGLSDTKDIHTDAPTIFAVFLYKRSIVFIHRPQKRPVPTALWKHKFCLIGSFFRIYAYFGPIQNFLIGIIICYNRQFQFLHLRHTDTSCECYLLVFCFGISLNYLPVVKILG